MTGASRNERGDPPRRRPLGPLVIADRRVPAPGGSKLLLCDRDGVIVEDRPPYIGNISQVALIPRAVDALREAERHGFSIVVASNQAAVGRGYLSAARAIEIHRSILDQLRTAGVRIACSYLCPHSPEDACGCRKPAPGLINAPLSRLGIAPGNAVFVGDALEDMLAAVNAGVRPVLVRTGRGHAHELAVLAEPALAAVSVFADLFDATVDLCGQPGTIGAAQPAGDLGA